MRKLLSMLTASLFMILASCAKDEPKATATLNVKELTTYVGKTADYVKANFKSGNLEHEGGTLGKTTLRYGLPTKATNYSVTFKSNTAGVITRIDVYGAYRSYSEGINDFKAEMDKIDSTLAYVTYIARYNRGFLIDFTDRKKFWDYVAENDVSKYIQETWLLINDTTIKFNVTATFNRSTPGIEIRIEKQSSDYVFE